MKKCIFLPTAILALAALPVFAQETDDRRAEAIEIAENSGICGDRGVADAFFQEDGSVGVQCDDDATAFVPLAGGLAAGPALAAAAAALALGAAGGGGATPDTQ